MSLIPYCGNSLFLHASLWVLESNNDLSIGEKVLRIDEMEIPRKFFK